jgi:cytochrome oxidase Cu insertion factor (SCO1/SenC/PrrC family)
LVLGGISAFVLSLFVFFSPLVGLVKHTLQLPAVLRPEGNHLVVQRDGKTHGGHHLCGPSHHSSFIDRYGRPFTEKDVAGKIIIADFFFTRCTTICPA